MGGFITTLLELFGGRVPDPESNARILELSSDPTRWSAGHAVFDEVRGQLLVAMGAKDGLRQRQYHFEESCCQAIYNATDPPDPFDAGSAFFVVVQALGLARAVKIPTEEIVDVFVPPNG